MYTKNNTLYSKAYYILKGAKIAFQVEGASKKDYKEEKIDLTDITFFQHKKYLIARIGGLVNITIQEMNKKWLKSTIISKRYDKDDQIAIILNKDLDKEHLTDYNRMQEWRNFADDLANAIIQKYDVPDK